MSIELDVLRYLGVVSEAAYGVDESGTGSFLAVPFKEGSLQQVGDVEMLDTQASTVRQDAIVRKVPGKKTCTLAAGVALHSHGVDLQGTGTVPTVSTWALLRMLKVVKGGVSASGTEAAATEVQASSTTTLVKVTSGHGDRFSVGQSIGCVVVSGSSNIEVRPIEAISGDDITVRFPFSAAPVTGSSVRGGITTFITDNPSESLQALVSGVELSDRKVYCGLQGSFSLALNPGGLCDIVFNLTGTSWANLGDGSALTGQTFSTLFSPPVAIASDFNFIDFDGNARNVVHASAITVEPKWTYTPQTSFSGAEGVARMRRQAGRPALTYSFVTPFETIGWYTDRDNRTYKEAYLQIGRTPGSIVCIEMPKGQIVNVQPAASAEGISGVQVSVECTEDSLLGSTAGIQTSPLRMHFL